MKAVKAKADPAPTKAPTPPTKPKSKSGSLKAKSDGYQTPPNKVAAVTDDLSMLGIDDEQVKIDNNPLPAMSMKQAELIEKIKQEEENEAKKRVSLVVVGMLIPVFRSRLITKSRNLCSKAMLMLASQH